VIQERGLRAERRDGKNHSGNEREVFILVSIFKKEESTRRTI